MNHVCDVCDYSTGDISNLKKHNKTKKHLIKIGELIKKVKKFICTYCGKTLSTNGNLKVHMSTCKKQTEPHIIQENQFLKKQLEERNKIIETKDKEMVEILKKQIESKDKQLEMNAKLLETKDKVIETKDKIIETQAKVSDNTDSAIVRGGLAFCRKNYPNAVVLETIDFDEAFPKDDKFEEWIIYRHKEKQLPAFFGDGISAVYLEAETGERSVWCSDISRLTYIIRETGARKPKWITDGDGNKFKLIVIEPILMETKKIITEFSANIKMTDYDGNLAKISNIRQKCLEVCKYLDSIELPKAILRHIAPKFKLDMTIDD